MIQNSSYLICRNGIYYHSRRVPADLKKRFNKDRVIVSLRTRSRDKACRSSEALSDRLERYWESLRLEFFHSRELGLHIRSDIEKGTAISDFTIDDAVEHYLSQKDLGRQMAFFEIANPDQIPSLGIISFIACIADIVAGAPHGIPKHI